jgi:hypothetical protein
MNDLDRDSQGKRQAYRQESSVVVLAAARANTVTAARYRTWATSPHTSPTD